ncbi:MAG: sulfurtransferase TusA family protein, partial [Thermoplasmata archaeon]
MDKDATLDARGLMCPMPIVQLAKKVKELKSGQVLELVADDIGA